MQSMTADARTCSVCGLEKDLSQYYVQSKGSNGRVTHNAKCKPCYNAEHRARYAAKKAAGEIVPSERRPKETFVTRWARCEPDGCVFYDTCRAQIRMATFDPYCFVESRYHGLFVNEYSVVV